MKVNQVGDKSQAFNPPYRPPLMKLSETVFYYLQILIYILVFFSMISIKTVIVRSKKKEKVKVKSLGQIQDLCLVNFFSRIHQEVEPRIKYLISKDLTFKQKIVQGARRPSILFLQYHYLSPEDPYQCPHAKSLFKKFLELNSQIRENM